MLIERTTAGIPERERLDYWRECALRRMVPVRPLGQVATPFNARLLRVVGEQGDFFAHASDAILAERTRRRCASDDCDDISLSFMVDGGSERTRNHGEFRIAKGDVYVVDYGRPVHMRRTAHLDASIILPRGTVREAIGRDPAALAGLKLGTRGIGALLMMQVRTFLEELPHLDQAERALVLAATTQMVLAALQAASRGVTDSDQFGGGVYELALRLIERHCVDPTLTPVTVAAGVGCSRATLYRLFTERGRSISATIWSARLDFAARLLRDVNHLHLEIGEIAFRAGFLDQPGFSRMFKRHFGVTAGEMRQDALFAALSAADRAAG